VPELDGLRGLAVVAVMVFHQTVMSPATRFDHEFVRLAGFLNAGVDLFFVLSGFLITGILFDGREARHGLRNFYARRTLRIVPLYYAVLFVAFVVLPWFQHPKLEKWGHTRGLGQIWYWLFLSNWSIALGGVGFRHGMVDLSWTLSIEEQFYLTWPLIVRSLPRGRLLRVCAALAVAALATRAALVLSGAPPIRSALFTPARMDGLVMGAWVALMARGGGGVSALVPAARRVAVAAGVSTALLVLALGPDSPHAGVFHAVYTTPLAATFAAVLVLAVGGPESSWLRRGLRSRFLTTFGAYSYALYLFHNPVQAFCRDRVFPPASFPILFGSPLPGQLLFYALATAPALALAWLSWHVYEKPWLSLKRFFPSAGAAIPGAAGRRQAARASR